MLEGLAGYLVGAQTEIVLIKKSILNKINYERPSPSSLSLSPSLYLLSGFW